MMTNSTRSHYLAALGVTQWFRRELPAVEHGSASFEPNMESPALDGNTQQVTSEVAPDQIAVEAYSQQWQVLRQQVSQCQACGLYQSRTQTVFGIGDERANWLIIGEAPGAEEDAQGEPFVGRAGKLLNNMLLALGLSRSDVYIANILKCRPPNNRDPQVDEVASCEHYLQQQVALIKPVIILAVGRIAAQNLLKSQEKIGTMRGKRYEYGETGIPLVATYHPAYLLRAPREKRKSWEDLLFAKSIVESQHS